MEVKLGPFKHAFVLESWLGTNTVSIESLEQSASNVAYAYFLFIIYFVDIAALLYSQVSRDHSESSISAVFRCIGAVLPIYSIIKGIYDYKTKISAALDLEAMQRILEYHNFSVPENTLLKWMPVNVIASQIVMVIISLYVVCFENHDQRQATEYIPIMHLNCTVSIQGVLLVFFFTKVQQIQSAIRNAKLKVVNCILEEGSTRSQAFSGRQPRRRQQRMSFNDSTEEEKQLLMLTDLEGSLIGVEDKILKSFWVLVVWVWFFVGSVAVLFSPAYMSSGTLSPQHYIYLIYGITFIVSFVFAAEMIHQGKTESQLQMAASMEESHRLKRQLLGNIHRSRRQYSCALFDINYALLFQIAENSMFVITTLFGNTGNHP